MHCRCLPCPVWTDERDDRALLHSQADILDRDDFRSSQPRTIGLLEIVNLDNGFRHRGHPSKNRRTPHATFQPTLCTDAASADPNRALAIRIQPDTLASGLVLWLLGRAPCAVAPLWS